MKISNLLAGSAMALVTLAAGGAQASTLFTLAAPTAAMASPASTSVTFGGGAGAGSASFRLNGFGSLDGDTYYTDAFTLSLNGQALFSGTFDLGGGSPGHDLVLFGPAGSSATAVSFSYFQGGYADIFVPLSLAEGSNTLTFAYASPGWSGPEGFDNESWGLQTLAVDGIASAGGGAIPEPATWLMMIMGFGGMGALLRRIRHQAATIAA